MFSVINQKSGLSLLLNVFLAVGLGLLIDALVFSLLLGDAPESPTEVSFAPSGAVVGTVWVILFGLMGAARWVLNYYGERAGKAKWWIVALLLFCFAYPFYTLGLSSVVLGLIGNLATIALTIFVIIQIGRFSKKATFLLVPMIIWLCFASVITLAELKII